MVAEVLVVEVAVVEVVVEVVMVKVLCCIYISINSTVSLCAYSVLNIITYKK